MSGKYNGVQALILETYSVADYTTCSPHSLNLMCKSSAECCSAAIEFNFDILQGLNTWVTASAYCSRKHREKLDGFPELLSKTRLPACGCCGGTRPYNLGGGGGGGGAIEGQTNFSGLGKIFFTQNGINL